MRVNLIDHNNIAVKKFELSSQQNDVFEDLELEPIVSEMTGDDKFLRQVVLSVLFAPMQTSEEIYFRQAAVKDSLTHRDELTELYTIVSQGLDEAKNEYWSLDSGSASYKLHSNARQIDIFLNYLEKLTPLGKVGWRSTNFKSFFQRLKDVFKVDDLTAMHGVIQAILANSTHSYPVKLTADFGSQIADLDFSEKKGSRLTNIFGSMKTRFEKNEAQFVIPDRDDNSSNALGSYDNQADYHLAIKVVNTEKELENFFIELQYQLGFLIAIGRLTHHFADDLKVTYPTIGEATSISDLKNVVLLLHTDQVSQVVGNDLSADKLTLVVISGVNQGGKTTTLRSLGQAQMMMQAGMYVFAQNYQAPIYHDIYTHFKREEDSQLNSGKLDLELQRMSEIIDELKAPSLVLMNESFSSTNEHEGSQINAQVVSGLVNSRIAVISVNHQFEFVRMLKLNDTNAPVFLRPERLSDGSRSFKLILGKPLKTSFGVDIYDRVFNLHKNNWSVFSHDFLVLILQYRCQLELLYLLGVRLVILDLMEGFFCHPDQEYLFHPGYAFLHVAYRIQDPQHGLHNPSLVYQHNMDNNLADFLSL